MSLYDDHPLTDLETGDVRSQFDDIRHDLVSQHCRNGEVGIECAVGEVVPEVAEDLLGIGTAMPVSRVLAMTQPSRVGCGSSRSSSRMGTLDRPTSK